MSCADTHRLVKLGFASTTDGELAVIKDKLTCVEMNLTEVKEELAEVKVLIMNFSQQLAQFVQVRNQE